MIDNISLILFNFFEAHTTIVSFVSALFGGEPAILVLASISAGQGLWSVLFVVFVGYTTAIIGELFWFLIARSPVISYFDQRLLNSKIYNKCLYFIGKVENGKPLRLLFLTRVISGFTIALIVYFGRNKMKLKTFLQYIMIVNIFWTPLIVFVGWSVGKSFNLLSNDIDNIKWVITITSIISIFIYFLYKKITTHILKKSGYLESVD